MTLQTRSSLTLVDRPVGRRAAGSPCARAGPRAPGGHPGPQLPGARDSGRGRLRRRLARPGDRGHEDRRPGHRHVRRVLHGRDGQDPQPRAHRADPGRDGRLLAGRLDHAARPEALEGRAPRRGRRQLRQHDGRHQGRVGLLRDQRQRRGRRPLDSRTSARSCSCPISSSARGSRSAPAARTCTSGWASATSTPASAPTRSRAKQEALPERRPADPPGVRLRQRVRLGQRPRHDESRTPTCCRPRAWSSTPRPRPTTPSWWRPRRASCTGCTRRCPARRFLAADDAAVCRYMKQITLPKLRDTLRDLAPDRRGPAAGHGSCPNRDRAHAGGQELDSARSARVN